MKRFLVDATRPDSRAISEAARVIRAGGLVAFPTETVYGLGANALDPAAIARIYAAKGRPAYNPLIAHCEDAAGARLLAAAWSAGAEALSAAFWPGPLTIIVPKREVVPAAATAGLPTVAIRVPSHPVARALISAAGVPIAAPSANRSTELSPTTAEHVTKGLSAGIDVLLDAGPSSLGIESTVIDLSGLEPVLLRPGTLSARDVEQVLGRPLATAAPVEGGAPRPAPGMLDRHYAPRATLVMVPRTDATVLRALAGPARGAGGKVAALLLDLDMGSDEIDQAVRMPASPEEYARALYATLHRLDDTGYTLVLVEEVPDGDAWAGVRDRLARAAAPE